MSLTVDSSVFVSSTRPGEIYHSESLAFVERIDLDAVALPCPTIVLAEAACAMARTTSDPAAPNDILEDIESLPGLSLVPLTPDRARQAAEIGADYRLRGADAVYVQTARESGATLITWDNELLTRAPAIVPTMTPSDWLAANAPESTVIPK